MGYCLLKYSDCEAVDMTIEAEWYEATKITINQEGKSAETGLYEIVNIDWLIGIHALTGMEKTNKERPTQHITGGTGDSSKGKQVQFQSEHIFNFEEDISLKTTRINPQIRKGLKQKRIL